MTTYNATLSAVQDILEFFGQFSAPQNYGTPSMGADAVQAPPKYSGFKNIPQQRVEKTLSSTSESAAHAKVPSVTPVQYKFINWAAVSEETLSMVEYYRYAEHLDWSVASKHIDAEIVPLFSEYIDWPVFVATHPIGLKNLRSLGAPLHTIKPRVILEHQPLTPGELDSYARVMDIDDSRPVSLWHLVCRTQLLSEEFIEKHADKLDWEDIFVWQAHLGEEFLGKHRQRVSRDFVETFTSIPRDVVDRIYN